MTDCFLPNIILQSMEKPDMVCAGLVWHVFHILGKQAIFRYYDGHMLYPKEYKHCIRR